jgi:hypothetical protein
MALCSLFGLCPLLRSATSTALYPLYGPLLPLQSSVPLRPTVLSVALNLLYSRLSPSKALCPLFTPLSPSTIFCTLYGPMSPLRSSAPYGPLLHLRPSILSTALYLLYGSLRPSILSPWPSVSSTALCPLYCPLSLLQPLSPLWPSVSSKALCLL